MVSQDALDRVKAFLVRTRDVEGHFTLRFGETGITIGDLREVVAAVEQLLDSRTELRREINKSQWIAV